MHVKGRRTKKHIIATAAPVFNVRGFAGTSIAEILEASGFEKGGLYRHFASKDDLALASFDYAVGLLERRHAIAQTGQSTALDRLSMCVRVVAGYVERPPLAGGCPILNTAIEADDTHPALRKRAADAMHRWQRRITQMTEDGVTSGELRPETDPAAVASVLTAALEGAVMVAALLHDSSHMERVSAHLQTWLASLAFKRRSHARARAGRGRLR